MSAGADVWCPTQGGHQGTHPRAVHPVPDAAGPRRRGQWCGTARCLPAARAGAGRTAPKVGMGVKVQWHHRAIVPSDHLRRQGASLCRRRRLAGALLWHMAVPGHRWQPQPLCYEPVRVLPAPLGAQLEERLQFQCTVPLLHPPAPCRWVWGSRGLVGPMGCLQSGLTSLLQERCPHGHHLLCLCMERPPITVASGLAA